MVRVQADDHEAFAKLYDRHAVRAYWVARAVCGDAGRAEDAVQEGFLSIWRARARYRGEHGSFQAWAMTAVRNRALDIVRAEAATKRPDAVGLNGNERDHHAPSSEMVLMERAGHEALIGAVRVLPDAQAEVITLAFFGGLTHTEIADQLALAKGTVKGRIRLGLEKLHQSIDDPDASSPRGDFSTGLTQD